MGRRIMDRDYRYVDPDKVISEEKGDYFYQIDENISIELLNYDNLSRNRHFMILRQYEDYSQATTIKFEDKTSDLWDTAEHFCYMIDKYLRIRNNTDDVRPHCMDLENLVFFDLDYYQNFKYITVKVISDKPIDNDDFSKNFNPHTTFDEIYRNMDISIKKSASSIFLETNTICWVIDSNSFILNLNEGLQNSAGVIEFLHFENSSHIGTNLSCKSTRNKEEQEDMLYNMAYKMKQIFADYDRYNIGERFDKWRVTQSILEERFGLYFANSDYKIIRDDIAPDKFKIRSKYLNYDNVIQKHNEVTDSNLQSIYDF